MKKMDSEVSKKLRVQTKQVIELFEDRVKVLQKRRDLLQMFRNIDPRGCLETARKLIGEGEWTALGIDGSMDFDEHLDLLLFYVYATGYKCPFYVRRDGVSVDVKNAVRNMPLSASAAIPLWVEDLLNVSRGLSISFEYEVRRIAEAIPISIMTMAELFLALKSIENPTVKLLLLDRPLSGTYPSLLKSSRIILSSRDSVLTSMETTKGRVSLTDIWIASILGPGCFYVPPRRPYSEFALIKALLERHEISKEEACAILNVDAVRLEKILKHIHLREMTFNSKIIDEFGNMLRLRSEVFGYWDRVYEASIEVSNRIFKGVDYPLRIGESWLTSHDINLLNLFLLYELLRRALANPTILVGIAKDTEASEIVRSVIPFMRFKDSIKVEQPIPSVRNNRRFLSLLSSLNYDVIKTPWRTPCYDSCFTTISFSKIEGFRPARKVVSREALLIRVNFQLKSLEADEAVRSMVFMYDRPFNPLFDKPGDTLNLKDDGGTITIRPVFEGQEPSLLDDLILYLLSLMDNPEVLEAYGYNQLLYLADKAVKIEVEFMKSSLRTIAELELAPLASRRRLFTFRSYRELRRILEVSRRLGS
ncbi:MAG: hypothetical protein QXI36_02525 [Candidatus Bathyarchaeia archaeon]